MKPLVVALALGALVARAAPPRGLAWIAEVDGVPQVVLDGAPLTRGPAAHYLSATGREGLYVTRSENGTEQLALLSFDGGVTLFGEPSPRAKGASTGGGLTLFESGEHGLSQLVDLRGRVLISDAAGAFEPSVAPDGRWFAFVSSRDGDAELYRASADGGQQQRLTAFHLDDVAPRVSPDGRWIVFVSNREGQDRLFLVRPDGRGQRRLHADAAQDTRWDGGALEPAEADATWTPDSRAVVFSARGPRGHWHLFKVDVASGRKTRLTDGPHDDQLPAVSPDGRWIAFVSNRDGDPEVYLLGPSGLERLTRRVGADWRPLWLPPNVKPAVPVTQ
ncbi:MAG: TolB family protein [Myxococcota bacterium]